MNGFTFTFYPKTTMIIIGKFLEIRRDKTEVLPTKISPTTINLKLRYFIEEGRGKV